MWLVLVFGFMGVIVLTWWVDTRLERQAQRIEEARNDGLGIYTDRELRDELERRSKHGGGR